jgi:membrane-bound lytic murein transglycosylase MltF
MIGNTVRTLLSLSVVCVLFLAIAPDLTAAQQSAARTRRLPTQFKPWKGDFDAMIGRRVIRVLVPYSRTLYFNDRGRERGVTVDIFRAFERYLNKTYKKRLRNRPVTVFIIPTTRDRLLENIANGLGDIGAGNLTVTDDRMKAVDFYVAPDQIEMSELVLTGPKSSAVTSTGDLSGKVIHVRRSSSYYESLVALNERFVREGRPALSLVPVPDALEDEDMMEMLNAGLLEAIVVDDWKAKMWAQVLPKIVINEGAAVRSDARTGWAIRKDCPQLKEVLGSYFTSFVARQGHQNDRSWLYRKRIKELKDATATEDYKRFESLIDLFTAYGERYAFDPLMLAAQGYQESQLDQGAKSPVGAIGIMQVMPATGRELKVGDIRIVEPNIHAGAKYMDLLMTKFLGDATFDETNRTLFAFACYNGGPAKIARLRREAEKRGLDPNKWFDNVEIMTAEKLGIETTTYVRNIFKYYVSYKLMLDMEEAQRNARLAVPK